MGSHSDGVSIAAAIHTTTFGGSVSYTPPGGSASSVDAIPYPVRTERRDSSIGVIEVQVRDLIVEVAALANPVILGVFTISSETWKVIKREKTANRWLLTLEKVDISELNRAGYRRGMR